MSNDRKLVILSFLLIFIFTSIIFIYKIGDCIPLLDEIGIYERYRTGINFSKRAAFLKILPFLNFINPPNEILKGRLVIALITSSALIGLHHFFIELEFFSNDKRKNIIRSTTFISLLIINHNIAFFTRSIQGSISILLSSIVFICFFIKWEDSKNPLHLFTSLIVFVFMGIFIYFPNLLNIPFILAGLIFLYQSELKKTPLSDLIIFIVIILTFCAFVYNIPIIKEQRIHYSTNFVDNSFPFYEKRIENVIKTGTINLTFIDLFTESIISFLYQSKMGLPTDHHYLQYHYF